MIEKTRLDELIKQGATIYYVANRFFDNSGDWYIVEHKLTKTRVKDLGGVENIYKYKRFYETKEEADEYLEFGNITRTERLELPSWEEVKKVLNPENHLDIEFTDTKGNRHALWLSPVQVCVVSFSPDGSYGGTDEPLTKENYTEARRLAVKLFKGENYASEI